MQYWGWRAGRATLGRTPAPAAYWIAGGLGRAAYWLWPRGRRAMRANFARVLGTAERRSVDRVGQASLAGYFRYLLDFMRLGMGAASLPRVDGEEAFAALDRLLERGRGAVIVCMHYGNWDAGAACAASRGYPLAVVAEGFGDARLDELVLGTREQLGMEVIRMERAGPSMVRVLRRNGLLALLIDRPVPGQGVPVRFFGETVEVPAGPARLAVATGAALVPVAFRRVDGMGRRMKVVGDFSIVPCDEAGRGCVETLTQRVMEAHERFIREQPEQWYMFRELWQRGATSGGSQ
ncbi:MAG: acyltransferase [Tepidiforma sp.]|nr:MAG: acyltransferase [Tepidiforma sp.]GIW14102.1 MAG: acyltransferase [Tepidiforma sp.]